MQAAGLVVGQKTKNHIYREMTGHVMRCHNTNVTSDLCDTLSLVYRLRGGVTVNGVGFMGMPTGGEDLGDLTCPPTGEGVGEELDPGLMGEWEGEWEW